jgi:hypothetical protein
MQMLVCRLASAVGRGSSLRDDSCQLASYHCVLIGLAGLVRRQAHRSISFSPARACIRACSLPAGPMQLTRTPPALRHPKFRLINLESFRPSVAGEHDDHQSPLFPPCRLHSLSCLCALFLFWMRLLSLARNAPSCCTY